MKLEQGKEVKGNPGKVGKAEVLARDSCNCLMGRVSRTMILIGCRRRGREAAVSQILKEGDIDEHLKDNPDFLQQPAKRQRSQSHDSFGLDPLLSVSPVSSTSNSTAAVKTVSTAASARHLHPSKACF